MRKAAIVLCGGRSSRMGRPKAWLPWGAVPMVAHVVGQLGNAVDETVVVSAAELDLPPLDATVVVDRDPGLGPLAGIREGLAAIESDFAFVTGVDVPFLTVEFIDTLFAQGGAAAPIADGHVQALTAIYPRSAAELAERLLADGERRPLTLLEAVNYTSVDAAELPCAAWKGFNTPQDYLAATRATFAAATATLELVGRARLLSGVDEMTVPIGTLREVLEQMLPKLELVDGDRVAEPFLVSLDGRQLVRDATVPVGPGERVLVLDAQSGG